MLIPNQEMLQEQSNQEIARTKESAHKGHRPIESFRTDCSKWLVSIPFSASEGVCSILRLAEWPRAGESTEYVFVYVDVNVMCVYAYVNVHLHVHVYVKM